MKEAARPRPEDFDAHVRARSVHLARYVRELRTRRDRLVHQIDAAERELDDMLQAIGRREAFLRWGPA